MYSYIHKRAAWQFLHGVLSSFAFLLLSPCNTYVAVPLFSSLTLFSARTGEPQPLIVREVRHGCSSMSVPGGRAVACQAPSANTTTTASVLKPRVRKYGQRQPIWLKVCLMHCPWMMTASLATRFEIVQHDSIGSQANRNNHSRADTYVRGIARRCLP